VNPKQIAAEKAVSYIQDGMRIGLGTGSTAAYAVSALGRRLEGETLRLSCVATSMATEQLAQQHGIALETWDRIDRLDLSIDGADEVDPQFRLIKGGGGALLREKLVAMVTDREIIIVDDSKIVPALGRHPLPVVVTPYAWQSTQARLITHFGVPAPVRYAVDGSLFLSDDGCYVLDMAFGAPLPDLETLEARIKSIVGVVETGLFIGLCQHLIIGSSTGEIREQQMPRQ
jgi:ribose 5-phosphate isomerase A